MNKTNNKQFWDSVVQAHLSSDFYDVKAFLQGQSSLNPIELALLGDISGKDVLHLQCHFGLDSLSLARQGAKVSALDFSGEAIAAAKQLAKDAQLEAHFIQGDVLEFRPELESSADIVFASYGVIGWFGDLDQYAHNVMRYLKPGGKFVLVEFHPLVHMFDDDFKQLVYPYDSQAMLFEENGSYAGGEGKFEVTCWNHSISSLFNAFMKQGAKLSAFEEHNYSPYPCFTGMIEDKKNEHVVAAFGRKLPYVYASVWEKA
ncbi:MAG: class I SAM-dependent methyltransferase [Flavobacteriales bacterium]|nr:class I SAM-dependent methyltransferase [Flavobacteriales bacterium]MDG1767696.1 class I SAM-dependent methyltransferase [Flavobacteriales bacterium]